MTAIGGLPARVTSGFRTPEHNRAVGGVPNSRHLDGDAVDLVPDGVGMADLHRLASDIAGQWHIPGARALNEGDHVHLQLPRWGRAPGSPQAAHAAADEVPPLPQGYTLDAPAPQTAPAPPPAVPTAQDQADAAAFLGKPAGTLDALAGPRPGPPPQVVRFSEAPPPLDPGFTAADRQSGLAVQPPPPPLPSNESYRTHVDPAKVAQLNDAFDKGAGVEELQTTALNLGLQPLDVGHTREMVNWRNAGKTGARFMAPDAHLPDQGPRPGESITDYYNRQAQGQTLDGPITPDHPFGRNIRERTEKLFRDMGYSDAPERAQTAALLPVIGGGFAWEQAQRHFNEGNYPGAVYQGSMAGLGMLPVGPGGEIRAGSHIVDAMALRVAATAGGEAPSIARAGEVLAGTVDDALKAGGTVTLRGLGEPRQIVGTNEAGELVDHTGAAIHPEDLAGHFINPPRGAKPLVDVNIPEAAPRPPVPGEALAADLPQEAPNEAARLGGGARAQASSVSSFTIHDPVGGDAPETVKFVLRPNGDSFIQRGADVIDTSAMTRAGSTPEEAIAQHLGEDTSGRNVVSEGAPTPRQRDYLDIPPLPHGYTLDMPGEQSALGFSGKMSEPRSAEEMAALARNAGPGSFAPPSSSLLRTEAEAMRANPDTMRAIEPPAAPTGRPPARPGTFSDAVKSRLDMESRAKGMPVRIDAEDAIDKGVPADLVYLNPSVADKSTLRVRYTSIFGTRYGKMTAKQQHLISLDSFGDADPVAWGFDHKIGQRLDPEEIGDLLGRSLQGDPSAFERGPRFDAWTAHQEAEAQSAEFQGRFPDGAPVERAGSPVTLDDLRANEPPATSYDDLLSTGRQRVANINLGNIHTRADIQRALEATEAHFGGFDAARRAGQGHAETAALANEAGMTADDLLRRRHGQALNAEQALRARQILAKSLDELGAMAADIERQGGIDRVSPETRADWYTAVLRHAAIYEQVTGATAEAGRALESFKIGAGSKAVHGAIHEMTAASGRGKAKLDDVAKMIVNLHKAGVGPGGVSRFVADAARPSTIMDKLLEVFYNSILSAPSTHAINMLGNSASMAMSVPEYALASLLGKIRGGGDRVRAAEVGGYINGLTHGVGRGWEAFKAGVMTGQGSDFAAKETIYHRQAIPGVAGKVIRTPTRFLMAEDEFFKGIARQGEIGRLAARTAVREGLTGKALAARIADLRANPPASMMVQAREFARYMTFQRDPGELGRGLQNWTDKHPWAKFLIPFIRTQENLVKFAAERSPAGLLMPTVRAELKAGGARRDLALAKIAIGSAVGLVAFDAAQRGIITGGEPLDANTRALLHASGWQPYSIKIGDRYVSYRRLDPLSLGISVAADFATYEKYMTPKERENSAAILAQLTSRNIASSFWMESVGNLFDLVTNPGKEAPNQAANIIGALTVPNIIAQPTASMDRLERRQAPDRELGAAEKAWQTIVNRVKGRIPGLRQTLPARLGPFGEPLQNYGRLGPDVLSPFQQRLVNPDPTYQNMLDAGLRVDQPGATVNRVPLTPAQHADYTRLSGQYIKDDLAAVQHDPEWRRLSDSDRKARFEQMKRDARGDARADLGLDSLSPDNPAPAAPPPLPKGYRLDAAR